MVNYKGYFLGKVGSNYCAFTSLQAAREVNAVYVAPKYYMVLAWVDDVTARSGMTSTYRLSAEKVKLDYEPVQTYGLSAENARMMFNEAAYQFMNNASFRTDLRALMLRREQKIPRTEKSLITTTITKYLRVNKRSTNTINDVLTYMSNYPTEILDNLNLRNSDSVISLEGKDIVLKLLGDLKQSDLKIVTSFYCRNNWNAVSVARVNDSTAEYVTEVRNRVILRMEHQWKIHRYDVKYGNLVEYLKIVSDKVLDDITAKEYQRNKMIADKKRAVQEEISAKKLQKENAARDKLNADASIRYYAEQARIEAERIKSQNEYMQWKTQEDAKNRAEELRISNLNEAGIKAMESLINALSPFEQRLLVFKYSPAHVYGEIRVSSGHDAATAYAGAMSFIDSSWSSSVLSKYGRKDDFLRVVVNSQFGHDILAKTKDVTGW